MVKKIIAILAAVSSVLAASVALAQPGEELVSKIFGPFMDAMSIFTAIVFGVGILGFVLLLVKGVLNWVFGGGFGRSMALGTWVRAVEALAIIPIIFFIIGILDGLGIEQLSDVADIMYSLLNRGWQIIIGVLGSV